MGSGEWGKTRASNDECISPLPTHYSPLTSHNGAIVSFLNNGSGTFLPQTPGVLSRVVQDNVHGLLLETTPQGITTAYPLNPQGYPVSVSYIQDAVGNRQTLSYSGGLLSTIQDPVGRFVSLSYSGGLSRTGQ